MNEDPSDDGTPSDGTPSDDVRARAPGSDVPDGDTLGDDAVPGDAGHRGLVLLLNGPNLDLLGQRQPEVYGATTLDEHVATVRRAAAELGLAIEHVQSNHEGEVVEAIHGARHRCAAIVVNPGAFTHYAWAVHDALAAFTGPVVEVHLSNPQGREEWRHTSVVAPVATGSITGLGGLGYVLAVEAVARLLDDE